MDPQRSKLRTQVQPNRAFQFYKTANYKFVTFSFGSNSSRRPFRTRKDEKQYLSNLNDRLANYIEVGDRHDYANCGLRADDVCRKCARWSKRISVCKRKYAKRKLSSVVSANIRASN